VAEGGFADRDKSLLRTIILAALNPGTHRSQVWTHGVSTLSVATRYDSGGFGFDGITMLFEGYVPSVLRGCSRSTRFVFLEVGSTGGETKGG
jgi:hypothetical protein